MISRRALLTILISCFSVNALADKVTIVSDRWFPYNGIPHSPTPGYMIEIARYAFEQGGHELSYQLMSWDRSLQLVKEGKKDCLVGTTKTEALGFVFPSKHLAADQIVFIRPKGSTWTYTGIDSLKNIKLGTIPGYDYSNEITHYIKHQANPANVTETKGKFAIEKNLAALTNGEIDVVVDSKNVLDAVLKKMDWADKIELAGAASPLIKLHIACSPRNPKSLEYTQLISQGLQQLRSTGQLQSILEKYGLSDWQHLDAIDD